MRIRSRTLLSLACAIVVAFSTVPASLAAQDATPPGGDAFAVLELAPGVTAEVFSGVPTDRAPEQTLYLARFTFDPGSEIFPHGHPGTTSLVVLSGSFGWTLLEGTATIVRASASGAPTGTEEVTEVGVEVVLEPGDAIYYEDDVVHTARGAGDEPAVVMGTLLLESGADLIMPADMPMTDDATPATPAS